MRYFNCLCVLLLLSLRTKMFPPRRTCVDCNRERQFHTNDLSDDGTQCYCPWCHDTLNKGKGAYSKAWKHQFVCKRKPNLYDPLCACDLWESMLRESELARAPPGYDENKKRYKLCFDYATYLSSLDEEDWDKDSDEPPTVKYPPISRCSTCHLYVQYVVGPRFPNCPYCWEWIYLGRGSAIHFSRHLSRCPNAPHKHDQCKCKLGPNEWLTNMYASEGIVENWT